MNIVHGAPFRLISPPPYTIFSTPADDGETLVVFGGRVTLGISIDMVLSEISVLDLNTLTWTRGNDNLNTRTNAICTLYNGTFLIWGGK